MRFLGYISKRSLIAKLFLVFACFAAALFVWAFAIEPSRITVENEKLEIPNWPKYCEGFRIAVLADLHVGSPWNGLEKLKEIVDATRAADPDLVLLVGDYVIQGVVGGQFVSPERAAIELSRLSAPAGRFAVLGNHDHWLDPRRVQTALESAGIAFLEDQNTLVEYADCSFWLSGVSDFWEGEHDLLSALEGVSSEAASILFTHNPDLFPNVPAHVNLTIAGHTHGGQVYLPGIGRPIVPSNFGERFAIGHIVEAGRHLYVSAGLGTSILPVRFLVPPAISILELHSAGDGPAQVPASHP